MSFNVIEIEITALPCGLGCGTTYIVGGKAEPVEVQRFALNDGWCAVEDDEGNLVAACGSCAQMKGANDGTE